MRLDPLHPLRGPATSLVHASVNLDRMFEQLRQHLRHGEFFQRIGRGRSHLVARMLHQVDERHDCQLVIQFSRKQTGLFDSTPGFGEKN